MAISLLPLRPRHPSIFFVPQWLTTRRFADCRIVTSIPHPRCTRMIGMTGAAVCNPPPSLSTVDTPSPPSAGPARPLRWPWAGLNKIVQRVGGPRAGAPAAVGRVARRVAVITVASLNRHYDRAPRRNNRRAFSRQRHGGPPRGCAKACAAGGRQRPAKPAGTSGRERQPLGPAVGSIGP